MTLPTRPHAIFSTLQGIQNPDTKPTLQRAKNANAQPYPPGGRNSNQPHLNISKITTINNPPNILKTKKSALNSNEQRTLY
jgi:hypothetical protein